GRRLCGSDAGNCLVIADCRSSAALVSASFSGIVQGLSPWHQSPGRIKGPRMYWKHFGLADEPFSLLADSRFLFLTDAHREVLGALRESVETERGFAALIAPPGVGKTTLLYELIEHLRETTVPVSIVQTNFE